MQRRFSCFRLCSFLALTFTWTTFGAAQEMSPPLLARTPTANRTHIVFSFAGDLWRVPRTGGEAVRLTNHPGIESDPIFRLMAVSLPSRGSMTATRMSMSCRQPVAFRSA